MSCSGKKMREAKAGRNASAATNLFSPAATASVIVLIAARQKSRPGAGRSSAVTGNVRKRPRNVTL